MGRLHRRVSKGVTIGTLATALLVPLLIGLVTWGANRYDLAKLDTDRFILDSARRDNLRASDRMLLERIDSRVGEMYCAKIPIDNRGGCR